MKTLNVNTRKRRYELPSINTIILDNSISLALESAPPAGPGEVLNCSPTYINGTPFKDDLV
jgi:hypothetical protein